MRRWFRARSSRTLAVLLGPVLLGIGSSTAAPAAQAATHRVIMGGRELSARGPDGSSGRLRRVGDSTRSLTRRRRPLRSKGDRSPTNRGNTPRSPGGFPFVCILHPTMKATLRVASDAPGRVCRGGERVRQSSGRQAAGDGAATVSPRRRRGFEGFGARGREGRALASCQPRGRRARLRSRPWPPPAVAADRCGASRARSSATRWRPAVARRRRLGLISRPSVIGEVVSAAHASCNCCTGAGARPNRRAPPPAADCRWTSTTVATRTGAAPGIRSGAPWQLMKGQGHQGGREHRAGVEAVPAVAIRDRQAAR